MSKPAPDSARSQSLLSQTKSDTTEAYVEDSEPEREVRRLQRKKKRLAKTHSQPVVIELTDSSASPPSVAASLPIHARREQEPIVVIEVSDGSGYSAPEDPREENRSRKIVGRSSGQSSSELSIDSTLDVSFPSIGKILGLSAKPASGFSEAVLKATTSKAEFRPAVSTPLSRVNASQESDTDTEEDDLLKLGQFAYAVPAAPRRTVSKTPSRAESEPELRPAAGKSKRAPVAMAYTFATDFTDAELSQIRRCVSCEQGWTVRKTVAHKMKHIQTCAKKFKLTNETVRILLRKELSNTQPVASTSELPAVPSPPASETLLEDALKDAQKKKAGRRPKVSQTVKDVSETRDNILDRARLLLQLQDTRKTAHGSQSAEAQDPGCVPRTQAFSRSDVATCSTSETAANLDRTHVFGPSKLDAARASRAQFGVVRVGAAIAACSDVSPLTQIFSASPLGVATIENHSDEAPPSTQTFSRSKFSNMLSDTRRIAVNEDTMDEPISLHDTSEDELAKSSPNRPTSLPSTPSRSANYLPPCASPTAHVDAYHTAHSDRSSSPLDRPRSPSPAGDGILHMDDYAADLEDFHVQDDYFYRWTDWNDDEPDGAYMHYNYKDDAGISKLPARTEDSPVPRRRELNPIPEDLPVPGPSRVVENGEPPPPEPPKKRTRKKKAASEGSDAEAALGKDISQEDLNARLQDAILRDETLHLRVLRYEPIHFEVFMKLATDMGIPAKRSGLKNKVRTFLDLKAIHFYGADPSKSRTKRVRHP
ncbi:hypothetical protein C8Q80DRAFT_1268180 [Daedaleopsis nitida]|nr:hypothetical protein C8Q80DRAFT_1268180 [Daedaleopsis nitida]